MNLSKNRTQRILTILLFIFGALFVFTGKAFAQDLSVSTYDEWNMGTFSEVKYPDTGSGLVLETDGNWGAISWRGPDKQITAGATFTTDGQFIYLMRGYGDVSFWKYSQSENKWYDLPDVPYGVYLGSELEYLDGYIYAFAGGYQNKFFKFSIANNSWEELSSFPELIHQGGTLTTDGTSIYALTGNSTQSFYKYDIENNVWNPLAGIPGTIRQGADLNYYDGYLYTPRGLNTSTFYRYNIAENTWSTMTNIPVLIYDDIETTIHNGEIYISVQNNTTSFYKYNIASNSWTQLANAPLGSRYAGVIYNPADNYIYYFRGNNDTRFWKYDIALNQFVGPNEAPATLGAGSNLEYVGGDIFTPRGANTLTYYRYNVASNTWFTMADSPVTYNDYVVSTVVGTDIYYLKGSSTNLFQKYDTLTNTWTSLATTLATVSYGGMLSYPGSGDYIYATRGLNTTTFWRYSISGNTWEATIGNLPAPSYASNTASIVSDGNNIYFNSGNGLTKFYRYNIALGTWSEVASFPFSPYYGTELTFDGVDKIYALAGWLQRDVWEYTISSDTWRKIKPLFGYGALNYGAYAGASIISDRNGKLFATIGNSQSYFYLYNVSDYANVASGTWTSRVYDLGYVASWGNMTVNSTTSGDSALTISTRTSSDGVTWSNWEEILGSTISSPENKLIQFKTIFYASTDRSISPKLNSISLNYTNDTNPPNSVSNVQGFSNEVGGTSISSEQTYNYLNPMFTWDVATDNETSVSGYYVYFGPQIDANPFLQGAFQMGNFYTVYKELASGNNYLRIVVQDSAGNKTNASTLFTYVYNGVSPVQTVNFDSSQFLGVHSNTVVRNDKITLENKAGGFWTEELISNAPVAFSYGSRNLGYVESLNKVYVAQGANNLVFYEYNLITDVWTRLADTPGNIYYGGGLVAGPTGYIYAMAGANSTGFWKYNISSNTWDSSITGTPLTVAYGGSLVYDGFRYIYVMRGNNSDIFWRYDTQNDEWENLDRFDFDAPVTSPSNNVYVGGSLSIDLENNKIYAIQGGFFPGFSVYDIDSNKWSSLGIIPILPYYGSFIQFDPSTNAVYLLGGNSTTKLYKYSIESGIWTQLASAPMQMYYGASFILIDDYLFTVRASGSSSIFKYSIPTNSWKMPRRGLFDKEFEGYVSITAGYGADIVKGDGDNFYITNGNYSDILMKWNESTSAKTRLPNIPVGMYLGSSMVYDNVQNKLYVVGSGSVGENRFFSFDIASNTWQQEVSDNIPVYSNSGSSMVYDGVRYIYFTRGGTTTSFYRFDTQGVAGSKWSAMAATPGYLAYGSELLLEGDYIYTLRGNTLNPNNLYRYTISTNTWTTLASVSTALYNDGFLANGFNGNYYMAKAYNTTDFFKYSVANNSWTQLTNAPTRIYNGGAGESNGTNSIYVLSGAATNAYSDALFRYVTESETSGFLKDGSYTSQIHDLNSVYKWSDISVSFTTGESTNVVISTRASTNASTWSAWSEVTREKVIGTNHTYKINSPSQRYLQVKFSLLSDEGIATPSVENYTINYYQDIVGPSNPLDDGFTSLGDGSDPASTIVSNTWNHYSTPVFSWALEGQTHGPVDNMGGSGVDGYYVYWGTVSDALPEEDGTYQTTNTFSPTNLIDGNTYYLRIRTKDKAGNLSDDIWQSFIQKYDVSAPSIPANLVADPSGYTSNNEFSFSWDDSTSQGALITQYCYKTGATEGSYSSDTCIVGTSVEAIPSYRVGTNTFQVRVKDEAGNYSNYASVSYFFVDAENAPAPPTNLTVTPQSSTSNSFGFDWNPPASGTFYGSVSNLSYLYSVNATPSQYSTSQTSLTYLNAGAYATLPGENIFYIVSKDEAGNVNYNDYASVTFTANTVAPGIPIDVEIADVSVKSTSSWKLAVSWDQPIDQGSGVGGYQIYRSTNGTDFSYHSYTSGTSLVDTKLLQQTYYYKVKACDSTNNCGAFSDTVSFFPDGKFTQPAELLVDPLIFNITPKKASVSWVTVRNADSKISYGLNSGEYFNEEVGNSDQVVNHELTINNLIPNTKYYYVVKWTDEDGNTGISLESDFTTSPPPTIEEPVVRKIGLDYAFIEFKTKETSKIRIFYGETSSFGGMIELNTGTSESVQTVELKNIKDGTKYYYKINTFDVDGAEYEGEIHSFETLPRPQILTTKIYQVTGTSASTLLVEWNTNTATSSIVTYYPSKTPAKALDEVNVALKKGLHRMVLLNLEANMSYTIIISGRDFMGNEATSGPLSFATAVDVRSPQIFDLEVNTEIIGTGQEATAQLVVSFKTDESSTSQVEYGEGTGTVYSQKSQEDATKSFNHIVIISGLTPSKVYHLRAISKDENSNIGTSVDKVVVTNTATANALDLALKNLVSIFSFLESN